MSSFTSVRSFRLTVAAGATMGLAMLAGCAETPRAAYEKILRHGDKGEFDQVWDRIEESSQAKIETVVEVFGGLAAAFAPDPEKAAELRALRGKELFVKFCELQQDFADRFRNRRVKSVEVEGDRATLIVLVGKTGEAKTETVNMVREDGIWKVSLSMVIKPPWP